MPLAAPSSPAAGEPRTIPPDRITITVSPISSLLNGAKE